MTPKPIPPSTILTPRLKLIRLTDTTEGSQHVQWFHENWSDPVATGWSLHGPTCSLPESRLWMQDHMRKWDNWFYSVFLISETEPSEDKSSTQTNPGTHIGSLALRASPPGPTLPPPCSFTSSPAVGSGAPPTAEEVSARTAALEHVDLNMRILGYSLLAPYQGKGYATEACRGLLDGWGQSIAGWRGGKDAADSMDTMTTAIESESESESESQKKEIFYIEAGVDIENEGSQRVLNKLGFRTVGMKVEEERMWLNGAWRGPGWWITGVYL